jgi:hypothetical protein
MNVSDAILAARAQFEPNAEVERFLAFVESSERGITV